MADNTAKQEHTTKEHTTKEHTTKEHTTELKRIIALKRRELEELEDLLTEETVQAEQPADNADAAVTQLCNDDVMRYSRQLILPQIAVQGQINLKRARVLVVGCGGLGCPAAIYLAAAGVGTIGLVDYDVVEVSNLHRQVAHGVPTLGEKKCSSLAEACKRLNTSIQVTEHNLLINSSNALDVISLYDVVVDASDNVPTRYLLSDACVLLGRKPLVSGSGLKFDGQLTVYNHGDSPCYRCIHPSPPPPNTVNNCSDGGVVGPVVGVIGCLQALEVVKVITAISPSYAGKLLVYDGLEGTFKTYRLRGRQTGCEVCGSQPSIHQLQDYPLFCGSSPTDKDTPLSLLGDNDRISAKDYNMMLGGRVEHVLLDVREPTELQICALPHPAINIRMRDLNKEHSLQTIKEHLSDGRHTMVVVCRRGNNSQKAVKCLKQLLRDFVVDSGHSGSGGHNGGCDKGNDKNNDSKSQNVLRVVDIEGGFYAWKQQVDPAMPIY